VPPARESSGNFGHCAGRELGYTGGVIRNCIFDWSGTLVDDLPAVWEASNSVFQRAGVAPLSLAEFRAEFSLPFKPFYDRYVPQVPLEQLEVWFHERFRQLQDWVMEIPHARLFLQFCRQHKLRTFLLSSVHPDHFAVQSAKTGFGEYLDHPYVGVWDKRTRIREIVAEHGLDPRETLFIGDMQHDVETAQWGGVRSCAVLTGFTQLARLRESGPDLIVEHLGELQHLMQKHGLELAAKPPATGTVAATADGVAAPRFPIVTVGALVFNAAGQVLLVQTQKWSNLWGIPGGKIKYGETSPEALRREVREETGLEIDDLRFVLAQDCVRSPEFYREEHFVLLNYTARCAGTPPVKLNVEAQAYRWLDLEKTWDLPLNQPTQILIREVQHGHHHH